MGGEKRWQKSKTLTFLSLFLFPFSSSYYKNQEDEEKIRENEQIDKEKDREKGKGRDKQGVRLSLINLLTEGTVELKFPSVEEKVAFLEAVKSSTSKNKSETRGKRQRQK